MHAAVNPLGGFSSHFPRIGLSIRVSRSRFSFFPVPEPPFPNALHSSARSLPVQLHFNRVVVASLGLAVLRGSAVVEQQVLGNSLEKKKVNYLRENSQNFPFREPACVKKYKTKH